MDFHTSTSHYAIRLLIEKLSAINPDFRLRTFIKHFVSIKSDLEKVDFVYNLLNTNKLLDEFLKDVKNDDIAMTHKRCGNEEFSKGNYCRALEMYTCCIASAMSQNLLAIAYGNRSACLFRLELYQDCIKDIDRAFDNNYPPWLEPKLTNRRSEAIKLQKVLEGWHDEIPEIPHSKKNDLLQSGTNSIGIKTKEEYGRCIFATRNIEVGEVLVVEKPFALVTTEQLYHCSGCMKLCYNLIPCPNCTSALYCSNDCKHEAFNSYHKYECSIFLSCRGNEIGGEYASLALRVLFMAKDNYEINDMSPVQFEQSYCSDRYEEIRKLNVSIEKFNPFNLFCKAVKAAQIFKFVKDNTDFFANRGQTFENEFKELLFRQLFISLVNAEGIFELWKDTLNVYKPRGLGVGIYSLVGLFNHSCSPNVEKYFYGSTLVLRAANTIKKGEQCFVSYDNLCFVNSPRAIRQIHLLYMYHFKCMCVACKEHWPIEILVNVFPNITNLHARDRIEIGKKIDEAHLETAKSLLPRLLTYLTDLKERERTGQLHEITALKTYITRCFRILGNKKRT